jgi:hypothetical protein
MRRTGSPVRWRRKKTTAVTATMTTSASPTRFRR